MRDFKEYVIFDSVTPQTLTSSTNASPTVITKTSHGLSTGDRVLIFGHTTNTNANGIWDVVRVDANTFKIKDIHTGVEVNANGIGADGFVMTAPKVLLVSDFRHMTLHVNTASSGNMTFKFAGSLGKNRADATPISGDCPNFGATQSDTNPYSFIATYNLEDASLVEGDTGLAPSGTDIIRALTVNTDGLKYFTVLPTTWTAGALTVKAQLFTQ